MAHWLSADIARTIASFIPDQLTLSRFCAVNNTCLNVARPLLFDTICILFRSKDRDLEDIAAFFDSHASLANYVHSLTLRGFALPPTITAAECAAIISTLPTLRKLRLLELEWVTRPFTRRSFGLLPNSLSELDLVSVWNVAGEGSPLDVAALAPRWSTVSIQYVEHRANLQRGVALPFTVKAVFIEETVWESCPSWFTPADCAFMEVDCVAFAKLDPYHFPLLQRILEDNTKTVQSLFVRIAAWCIGASHIHVYAL